MLKFFQVITYHLKGYNGFENDMIMTSEYQVCTEFSKFKFKEILKFFLKFYLN